MHTSSPREPSNKSIIISLGIIILIGALLRLNGLGDFTIGHIELFTPGIDLPEGISVPSPRLDLKTTIRDTIKYEPHPPGYYIFMLGWTKLFGTSAFSMRLPSVFLWLGSVILIYFLGALENNKITGLLSGSLLTLNGINIYWSQTAKLYEMGSFFGLLSTVSLVLFFTHSQKKIYKYLYIGSTLIGLTTILFFWPLFVTQILWVIIHNCEKKNFSFKLLQTQIVIFILGSPLLSVAAFQGGKESYFHRGDILPTLVNFFEMGFLFEAGPMNIVKGPSLFTAVILFSITIFLLAFYTKSKTSTCKKITLTSDFPQYILALCTAISFIAILIFAKWAYNINKEKAGAVLLTSFIPITILFFYYTLLRHTNIVLKMISSFKEKTFLYLPCFNSINFCLTIIPVVLLVIISLLKPIFASRTVFIFIPYLLICLSSALISLITIDRRWAYLILFVLLVHPFSAIHFKQMPHNAANFKGLAKKWIKKLDTSDIIFIQRHWAISPILYYINWRKYRFISENFKDVIQKEPDARIWTITVKGVPVKKEAMDALVNRKRVEHLSDFNIVATLYK